MKKIGKVIFSRLFIVLLAIFIQFSWMFLFLWRLSIQFTTVNLLIRAVAVLIVLLIVNRKMNPSYRLAWTFVILLSPVLGILIYLVFGRYEITKKTRKKLRDVQMEMLSHLEFNDSVLESLATENEISGVQAKYLYDWAKFPIYEKTDVKYFASGEEMFTDMLSALESAEKYIFLEFFILDQGVMLDNIIRILKKKVKQGVEVRLIYDDMGCINTMPTYFYKDLEKDGIRCAAVHPFRPMLSIIMNHRDHRKILVIDGKIAYTGGINLADEYINLKHRFGYWKDTGVFMRGEAVNSFTCMFLEMWNYVKQEPVDYDRYLVPKNQFEGDAIRGYVQPYGVSPLVGENVGENIYLNMISRAQKYIYIFTPYLILDHEMRVALCNAAKSGVDVRIVTPGIPDKKVIYALTRANYEVLLQNRVKIYEFTPGFLHAKNFVCDDCIATAGTVNLDYRSLYLHFECGTVLYETDAIRDMKRDALAVMKQSKQIFYQEDQKTPLHKQLVYSILRLFAPLL